MNAGVHGIVPCGTTGEAAALSLEERGRLITLALEVGGGSLRIVPGTGAPTLAETLTYTRQAQDLGADGALVVTPYFVKPDTNGLLEHYTRLHNATHLPLILYNNPGRTGVELQVPLIETLASSCPRIVGLKDSSTDLTRPTALRTTLGTGFALLSGEDATFGAFLSQGGDGIISVGAALFPHLYVTFLNAFHARDWATLQPLTTALVTVSHLLFQAPSPGPLKYLLKKQGIGDGTHRLPLGPLTPAHQHALDQLWETYSQ